MSTWRNWLRTLMPWTAGERRGSSKPSETPSGTSTDPSDGFARSPLTATADIIPDRLYPLLPLKHWATTHVSPYAWDRAVIRSLPFLQRTGIPLQQVLAPRPDTQIPGRAIHTLASALSEMYGIQPDLYEIFHKASI